MEKRLKTLFIEDAEADMALIIRVLERGGFTIMSTRVETEDELRRALNEGGWDLVLSDYSLPSFDAGGALSVFMETGLDIPFIIISQAIGEETAVALMKAGAHDYLMKDKLGKLSVVVERELTDAQKRREATQTEIALVESRSFLDSIIENQISGLFVLGSDGKIAIANDAARHLFKVSKIEIVGKAIKDLPFLAPIDGTDDPLRLAVETGKRTDSAMRDYRLKDNSVLRLNVAAAPIMGIDGKVRAAFLSFFPET